ncbi:MAG: hypothetical protein NTY02_19570 [Acidobacteria bacterium]|nr:hypothetical protein [Acidobacteriota bacterium]
MAIIGVLAAVAVVMLANSLASMQLGIAAGSVARELRSARMTAASMNQPVRVRFNCPSAGEYRTVELIGTPGTPDARDSDGDATRCSGTTYPYPAADQNPLTRPNNDGPIRRLPTGLTFGAVQTIEFWPNGSAHINGGGNPWPSIPVAGITLSVVKGTTTKSMVVNGLGKIGVR